MKAYWHIPASLLVLSACTISESRSDSEGADPSSVVLPEQTAQPAGGTGSGPASPAGPGTGEAASPALEYALPKWQREDVQPKSDKFGQTYGLEVFKGKTIVVVLLEGFCPFCRSNSVVAEQLQTQLDAEGLDVQVVVLSDNNATDFASRVTLPIFRDPSRSAWEELRPSAAKHDTFVFGPDGKRVYFWLGSYQGDATRWTAEVGAETRKVAKPKP